MRTIYLDKDIPRALAVITLRKIWPNVVWSPISPIHVVDMPEPPLPGPKWLRVRNRQCGLCATDLSLLYVKADPSIGPVALPGNKRFYLGHESVGEVVEVGSGVKQFKVGDRVVIESRFHGPNCFTKEIDPPCIFCATGRKCLCENASLNIGSVGSGGGWGDGYTAHESEVFAVPNGLDDDQASLIEPTSIALHGVLRHPPRAGEHVLIIGAGIIGLMTLQAVKLVEPDCHLTVLARYPHQVKAAQELGADEVVSEPDPYPTFAQITQAKLYRAMMNRGMLLGGFEVIYDCVGSQETVTDALRWARAGGTVVMVGIYLTNLKVDLNPIWNQEVDLIGSVGHGIENWRGHQRHTYDIVSEHFQKGKLKHEGLITHRFPFEKYRQAISTALDKRTGSIKVSFVYGDR
ncbi:MAG: zinc-binding dehydrogenase [Chloroflexota bacterium]